VVVGAGDIASCASPGDEATARLIADMPNATVLTLGDHAFADGTATEFADCYGPSWGRFKARTIPTVGNHDYQTPGASGYFGYFGAAAGDPNKGYYSYDLGRWHVVSLNSMCGNAASEFRQPGGCGPDSPMLSWLRQDLAANPKACTLATFHHPLFNSGNLGNQPNMKPIWDTLYAAGADVVLNAHQHAYERFAPQTPAGVADSTRGIREFVVGTGGASHEPLGTIQPNSQVRNADTYGVIELTLHARGYDWRFVPVAGESFTDSGSDQCH
jgi:acid phosphatase type 7